MPKKLATHAEIQGFLQKYNFFHDALLKAVRFTSDDYFSGKSQALSITGQFKANLTIYHYNYLTNKARKPRRFSLDLSGLGDFPFSSPGGDTPSRHLALTKIEVGAAKNIPDMWLMVAWGNKYDPIGAKWGKVKLAQIEFSSLRVNPS